MLEKDAILLDHSINYDPDSEIRLYNNDDHNVRITRADFDKIKLNDIIIRNEKNELTSLDTVYFCKSSITSRTKIKDYCVNNKIDLKKTNRIQYADTFVLNKNDIEKGIAQRINFRNYRIIPIGEYKDKFHISNSRQNKIDLERYNCVYCSSNDNYGMAERMRREKKDITVYPIDKEIAFIDPKDLNLMEILSIYTSNPDGYKIVFDQSISAKINDYELTPDTFENLENMLSSHDINNQKLAAEIISNCNRDVYKVEILLLLIKYANVLTGLKSENLNLRLLFEHFKDYKVDSRVDQLNFVNELIAKETFLTDQAKESLSIWIKFHTRNQFKNIKDLTIEKVGITTTK